MSKTKVMPRQWNNKPMFDVYMLDEDGKKTDVKNRKGDDARALVSFGIDKAKALIPHLEELKEYVEANS